MAVTGLIGAKEHPSQWKCQHQHVQYWSRAVSHGLSLICVYVWSHYVHVWSNLILSRAQNHNNQLVTNCNLTPSEPPLLLDSRKMSRQTRSCQVLDLGWIELLLRKLLKEKNKSIQNESKMIKIVEMYCMLLKITTAVQNFGAADRIFPQNGTLTNFFRNVILSLNISALSTVKSYGYLEFVLSEVTWNDSFSQTYLRSVYVSLSENTPRLSSCVTSNITMLCIWFCLCALMIQTLRSCLTHHWTRV